MISRTAVLALTVGLAMGCGPAHETDPSAPGGEALTDETTALADAEGDEVAHLESALTTSRNLGSHLASGQTIDVGEYLESSQAKYRLYVQSDGNIVIYRIKPEWKALWANGSWSKPVKGLTLTASGNIEAFGREKRRVYGQYMDNYCGCVPSILHPCSPSDRTYPCPRPAVGWHDEYVRVVYWRAGSATTKNKGRLYMQNDGNLVLYDITNWKAKWSSGTWQPN